MMQLELPGHAPDKTFQPNWSRTMPRVHHVKSARKANPVAQVGESYYWWKFRFGGKRYSKTYPKASQLTQSAYLGSLYDLIDMVNDYMVAEGDEGDVEALVSDVVDSLNEIRDECQDSLDNMPEALQYAPTGELLQERIDACDNAISTVECIEEPDQWEEERDRIEERDRWIEDEPIMADYEDDEAFEAAKDEWYDNEPDELEGFEEFERDEITTAIEDCIV